MKTGANKFAICLFLLLFCGFYCPRQSFAHTPAEYGKNGVKEEEKKLVTLNVTQRTLVYILSEIKKQTGLSYGFKDSQNANKEEYFSINVKRVTVDSALNVLLKDTKYSYQIVGELILISSKNVAPDKAEDIMKLKGRITDSEGNPIPNATIVIHGTTQGVVSDIDGNYELNVRPSDVLVVSFIGYKKEIIPIQGKKVINVALRAESEDLDEVQVSHLERRRRKVLCLL